MVLVYRLMQQTKSKDISLKYIHSIIQIFKNHIIYAWFSAKCWSNQIFKILLNQIRKIVTVLMELSLVREIKIIAQCD